jgi:NAD(P)-dependent dehydrogenase (short-subunit alcohol dehydrogenase family)
MPTPVTVLTGGTNGLGLITARDLARAGHTLLLVARDAAKAERVAAECRTLGAASVAVFLADLSRQADVRRVAAELRAAAPVVDVLVNNAGAIFNERFVTEDGLERTFALNHVAYFLLTELLRPALEAAPAARIVNVASGAHRAGRLDFADLQYENGGFTAFGAYGRSKLCNILFTRELARRLAGTRVVAHCYHPGPVATGFGSTMSGMAGRLYALAGVFMRTPEKGADTLTWLSTVTPIPGPSGSYWMDRKVIRPRPHAEDDAAAAKLWDVTAALVAKSA